MIHWSDTNNGYNILNQTQSSPTVFNQSTAQVNDRLCSRIFTRQFAYHVLLQDVSYDFTITDTYSIQSNTKTPDVRTQIDEYTKIIDVDLTLDFIWIGVNNSYFNIITKCTK